MYVWCKIPQYVNVPYVPCLYFLLNRRNNYTWDSAAVMLFITARFAKWRLVLYIYNGKVSWCIGISSI